MTLKYSSFINTPSIRVRIKINEKEEKEAELMSVQSTAQ